MVSTVNTGTINMPKLLRHIVTRTNNVREVVFHRDAIFNKSTRTTKGCDQTRVCEECIRSSLFFKEILCDTTSDEG